MAADALLAAGVRYCERGASLEFWAEPLNAITNAAFLVAAACACKQLRRTALLPPDKRALTGLVGLAAVIGLGSAAFHTMPSPITKLADVVPIAAFVAAGLYLALTRVLALATAQAVVWLLALGSAAAAIAGAAATLGCGEGACFNGTPGYLPVLAALAATAVVAHRHRSPAAPAFAMATLVFALALTARSLDVVLCPLTALGPLSLTAHAFWHLGTALASYLVIRGLAVGMSNRLTS